MRHSILLLVLPLVLATSPTASTAKKDEASGSPWSVELRERRYFNSHTSYEFGNPFPPCQIPLSRLEFPLDSWWTGLAMNRNLRRISLGFEALRNVSQEADGVFKDSDWESDDQPTVKTTYSESRCRMELGLIARGDLDLKVSDWVGLPCWLDARPVVGFRWQRFSLITHDGNQYDLTPQPDPPIMPLPGYGIRFEQTFQQYFLGMWTTWYLGRLFHTPPLTLLVQADWARVNGNNADRHLLRAGNRMTYEKTSGKAKHISVGLKIDLTQRFQLGIDLDHLKMETIGTHRLVNDLFNLDFSFDHGVRVWSEQTSLTASLGYKF